MEQTDVLIVGAGHAGAQLASQLRQLGYAGRVTVIGDEPEMPYERPPLSKEYLAGKKTFDRLLIRPPTFWEEHAIAMHLGRRVVAVSAGERRVLTDDGTEYAYGDLVWAAGGEPRTLSCPGSELAGLHVVRHRADVDRMATELADVTRVVVIGGGYIGLEAAAVLTELGKKVTVVEAQDRVLSRVAGVPLSRFYEKAHRERGVEFHLSAAVERLVGQHGRVCAVQLSDGTELPAQMVIVGIGIVSSVAPLAGADMAAGGVLVDGLCRTSLPHVYAIGDCAAHANKYAVDDAPIRLESVQNATDQAKVVAKVLTGQSENYDAVPWFWSDQYDIKLQTVGISAGHDETVVRGDPDSGAFSVVYLNNRRVIALDCVNAVRDYVQGKGLVMRRQAVDPDQVADPATPLKSLVSA